MEKYAKWPTPPPARPKWGTLNLVARPLKKPFFMYIFPYCSHKNSFVEIWKIKEVRPKTCIFCKIGKNQGFWAITASFYWFHRKLWNSNLNHFQQLLFHTISHPMNNFFGFSADILCIWKQTPKGKIQFIEKW